MKNIEEQLGCYSAYHRNPYNVATHFVGIPAIITGILIPMGWLRILTAPIPVTAALLFVIGVWMYYLALDKGLAFLMALIILPIFLVADYLSRLGWVPTIIWAVALFTGGWICQLVGHGVFERRKPAFVDNLIQLLIGPLFLLAETLFALGFRKELQAAAREISHHYDPVLAAHAKL